MQGYNKDRTHERSVFLVYIASIIRSVAKI